MRAAVRGGILELLERRHPSLKLDKPSFTAPFLARVFKDGYSSPSLRGIAETGTNGAIHFRLTSSGRKFWTDSSLIGSLG
ncbi:hypothetical protein GGC47_004898 [Bosea sp. OAE752]